MIIIIDNTQNLSEAFMTPKIITYFQELGVEHQIISSYGKLPLNDDDLSKIKAVIFSGGPLMLSGQVELRKIQSNLEIFLRLQEKAPDIPFLAICFGYQLIALLYGGKIAHMAQPNTGKEWLDIDTDSILMNGVPSQVEVFNHHQDYLEECPSGFRVIARTQSGGIGGIEHLSRPIWGLQFHPEGLKDTQTILRNLVSYADRRLPSATNINLL